MAQKANIVSTGMYVPDRIVKNAELKEYFSKINLGEVVDKLEKSSGILQRGYAPDDWASSDIAVPACQQAIERAGLTPMDIDLIILGTDSPDYLTPATSTVLQHKLGAKNAGTFDVACACATFPAGIGIGASLMEANDALKNVLVVSVYMMRKLADDNDITRFFYGDGAGAAILQPGKKKAFMGTKMIADGQYAKAWGIYSGGTAEPASVESVEAGRTKVKLVGEYPADINTKHWPHLIRDLAKENKFKLSDIDQIVFTQVNKHAIITVMDDLGIDQSKAHMIMDKWGYTGSACIPMALNDALEQGKVKKGDLVVMVGSGVGYNMAATAMRIVGDLPTT